MRAADIWPLLGYRRERTARDLMAGAGSCLAVTRESTGAGWGRLSVSVATGAWSSRRPLRTLVDGQAGMWRDATPGAETKDLFTYTKHTHTLQTPQALCLSVCVCV